jgi:hypothetical protein
MVLMPMKKETIFDVEISPEIFYSLTFWQVHLNLVVPLSSK